MTRTIRLMSEWGFYPFYLDEGDGRFEASDPEFIQHMFCLPEPVMQALLAWDEVYQDVLDWSDPASSDWASWQDEHRYIEQGRAAARLLRRHLAADVCIEYRGSDNITSEYY